jgi:hypothetical protein
LFGKKAFVAVTAVVGVANVVVVVAVDVAVVAVAAAPAVVVVFSEVLILPSFGKIWSFI